MRQAGATTAFRRHAGIDIALALCGQNAALAASVLQIILSLVVAALFWVGGDVPAARLREFLRKLCGETAVAALDVAAGAVRGVATGWWGRPPSRPS